MTILAAILQRIQIFRETSMLAAFSRSRRSSLLATVALVGAFAATHGAFAQDTSWMNPTLLAEAKKEGGVTLYTSINEEEALPILKVFEDATGIKVELVRNSDTGLLSRIMVENRAGRQSWDVIQTTAVSKMPQE